MTQNLRCGIIFFHVENCGITCQVAGQLGVLELAPDAENIKARIWLGEIMPN